MQKLIHTTHFESAYQSMLYKFSEKISEFLYENMLYLQILDKEVKNGIYIGMKILQKYFQARSKPCPLSKYGKNILLFGPHLVHIHEDLIINTNM